MKRGTRKKIGYGPFDIQENSNSKIWLQNEFLKTIERLEPNQKKKPLGDLAAQPFEEYVSYREKRDEQSILRREQVAKSWESSSGNFSNFNLLDQDDPLRISIWQWGEKYYLNSDWCYEVALQSLKNWYEFRESPKRRFIPLPFYAHPNYLGFGSLVMVYKLATMYGPLNQDQRALVDDFDAQKRQFVELFNEQQRIYLSYYPHDPHIWDDEFFLNRVKELIEAGLPSENSALPILNLLSRNERENLHRTLFNRAEELLERINEYARKNSVKPKEVGVDEVGKHLEWVVRYQVFDERFYSIGIKPDMDQFEKQNAYASVRKEALRVLRLIDLQPKQPSKGRPRML